MRADRASSTAAFVAACRGLASSLPSSVRLVTDPFGARLAHPALGAFADALSALPSPLRAAAWASLWPLLPWVVYMQVRTRVIDDALLAAVARGCDQVVILGAGLDVRAVRLAGALRGAAVYEVDHPATQARKREALDDAGARSTARYLAWDFEHDALDALPEVLATLGHDPSRPTFTIWEGVTMYLTREAIDGALAAVGAYSAPSSRLAFNYIDRAMTERPGLLRRAVSGAVSLMGEPFRTGIDPGELPSLVGRAGFVIERDERFDTRARAMLSPPWNGMVRVGGRLALAERVAADASRKRA